MKLTPNQSSSPEQERRLHLPCLATIGVATVSIATSAKQALKKFKNSI
jgi:hypothetical protein